MEVESPAFEYNQTIPTRYTMYGENVVPPLIFRDVPKGAETLAIIMDDPDAPGKTFVHWVAWNIPGETHHIPEGQSPGNQGKNEYGKNGYNGPRPPPGKPHHYYFKVYALDTTLSLPDGSSKEQLEKAMRGHIMAEGKLIGLYEKK